MKQRIPVLPLTVLVLAATGVIAGAIGQVPSRAAIEQRIARVEAHLVPGIVVTNGPAVATTMAARMRFHNVPGVSVAVINNGAVEWARGYGVREAGGTQPVTVHTRFQAASISKPVAAMAALGLVQEGRLALDEDVNAKLKSWKVPENDLTKQQKVTLRRILSHSAGLTVHGFPGYAADAPVPTLVQVLDGIKPANTAAIRVDLLPGSMWRYSGGGYTVMQQLLVDITGRAFPQLMKDTVLQPLGMTDSMYEQPLPQSLRSQAASAHGVEGNVIAGRYHTYPEMAAAGLWTTPTDLAKFAVAVRDAAAGRSTPVLSQATAKEMLTLQKGAYGLGLSLDGTPGRSARFGHGGANEGFRCLMLAYLDTGHGAVVMTNGDNGGRIAPEILRAVAAEYGWPDFPKAKEKTIAQIDPALYEAYAGRYELDPGHVVTIQASGGKLLLVDRAQTIELLPESATKFFELTEETDVEFVKSADATVTHFLVNGRMKARRLPT
jgi:CubicO group peptidase (beta-lactamase class C family)